MAFQIPDLKALTEPIDSLSLPLWLLTHPESRHIPRVRVLLDALRDLFLERSAGIDDRAMTLTEPS